MPTISLYIKDNTLRQIDNEVERHAALDKARGLSGRAITTRSSFKTNLSSSLIEESMSS